MRAILILISIMVAVPVSATGDDKIPYVHMKRCSYAPYGSYRDYWDQVKAFCFEKNGRVHSYSLSDMGEIKLRENGNWVENEYVPALNVENRREVETYKTYYVRYLSLSEPANGVVPFVAHVFFSWGWGTQTLYVFGELSSDGVKLTGFSNADTREGDLRAAYNTVTNLLSVFNGENPNRVGVDQTKREDRKRAAPVQDVVQKYREQKEKKDIGQSRP